MKDDHTGSKRAAQFLDFLNVFVMKVNSLRVGEVLFSPGGWRTSEKEGHALVYVLVRRESSFTFVVCNMGEGLQHHYAKAETSPPKLKRNMSFILDHIPLYRLMDSSFWYMIYR